MMRTGKTLQSIGQKFVRFEQHCARAQSKLHNSAAQAQGGRREIYRAAALAVDMVLHHNEDLEARVADSGFKGPEWFDDWSASWLAPIVMIGEDPRELLTAIQEGMTEQQYMAKGPFGKLVKGRSKRQAGVEQSERVVPGVPATGLSIEEQSAQWKARSEAFGLDNSTLRIKVSRLLKRVEELEHIVRRLHKISTIGG